MGMHWRMPSKKMTAKAADRAFISLNANVNVQLSTKTLIAKKQLEIVRQFLITLVRFTCFYRIKLNFK